jgi:hypothetical protein
MVGAATPRPGFLVLLVLKGTANFFFQESIMLIINCWKIYMHEARVEKVAALMLALG